MNDILIKAKDASLKLGKRDILSAINFEIISGEIAIFVGPNGGGKTSLIKMLLGLLPNDKGSVTRKDGLRISYVPQKFRISPFLPLNVRRLLNLTTRYKDDILLEGLHSTDSAHLLNAQVKNLSGGELQRVLLARAMLSNPELLVLDEALQGVDKAGEVKLNKLISDYSKANGTAIIMVSHDLHLVMKNTDKVFCINGHICCQGKPEQIHKTAEFKELFGVMAEEFALYHHSHDHSHEHGEQCDHDH